MTIAYLEQIIEQQEAELVELRARLDHEVEPIEAPRRTRTPRIW
jgi:hypothetical protein